MSQFSGRFIQVSEPTPHVLHIELSRKPVNAFSTTVWREYKDTFDRIVEQAHDIRAVVLSSSLPKIFTAGLDLTDTDFGDGTDSARASFSIRSHLKDFQHCIGAPERCPFPVIVAVHGPVIGLGIDLMSYCDIRYASSDATFSIKEVDIGLAADIGTLAFLPKITGNHSLARELAYTARFFTATEAEKLGFLSKVVDGGREGVIKEALDLAKVIASKSPVAVVGTKRLITHARDHSVAENLEYTSAWNAFALQTDDMKAALSARNAKQTPAFGPLRKVTPKL